MFLVFLIELSRALLAKVLNNESNLLHHLEYRRSVDKRLSGKYGLMSHFETRIDQTNYSDNVFRHPDRSYR